MKLAVLDSKGKATGREVSLPENLFGIEPNEHIVYLAVKSYLAAQRQGTSKSKERNEIKGSTRKIKKQKGTGTARAGDIKNPLFKGGGTVFGPKPRNYTTRMNRKEKQLARASALSDKMSKESISIVEDLSFDAPKTKSFRTVLDALEATGKVLYVHNGDNENVVKSARNLAKIKTASIGELHTYQIMHADKLIFSEGAINKLVE